MFYYADGSILEGSSVNKCIVEVGTFTFLDGSYLRALTQATTLMAHVDVDRRYNCRGRLSFDSCYRVHIPSGFGKCSMSLVDVEGELTGSSVAYVYPDGVTAIIGELSSEGWNMQDLLHKLINVTECKSNCMVAYTVSETMQP